MSNAIQMAKQMAAMATYAIPKLPHPHYNKPYLHTTQKTVWSQSVKAKRRAAQRRK